MAEEQIEQLALQNSDDESNVPAAHKKLLGAVSQLYEKKRVGTVSRKEPSLEVSEFHLSQRRGSHVRVTELARSLNKRATHAHISHKLKTAQKRAKTLPKPLEQIHADKINRVAGYEHTKRQLNRWDAVVHHQRVAENLTFPLQSDTIAVNNSTDVSKMFRKPTELEIEMSKLLKQPKPFSQDEDVLQKENETKEETNPLSLAKVIEKRKMMAKLRAQQSYKQAKSIRHSKIKSKKFHQIQRRARVKQQMKEFEELQQKDPEAALKKLEELDRTRAQERVTLRHRSTGQWAKNLAVRAKYDKEARIALSEQLAKSRELTVKQKQSTESDSEIEEVEEEMQGKHEMEKEVQDKQEVGNPNNLWEIRPTPEMAEFVSGYRKYWETRGKELEKVDIEKSVESSDKENNKPNTDNLDGQIDENVIAANKLHSTIDSTKEKKNSPNKNTFTVDNCLVSRNTSLVSNVKRLSNFKISLSTSIKNKKIRKNRNSQQFDKVLKEKKITCKSGFWTITKVIGEKTHVGNKKVKSNNKCKEIRRRSGIYQVTVSKNRPTTELAEVVESNEKDITEERFKKVKSLDELFEEVEDKLQSKIKEKLDKLNKSLYRNQNLDKENEIESESEEIPSLELKKQNVVADIDEKLSEKAGVNNEGRTEGKNIERTIALASAVAKPGEERELNKLMKATPSLLSAKFVKSTPRILSTTIPEVMTVGEDALDDEEITAKELNANISDAFAEEDVVDQFQKEKKQEVNKSVVADADLSLPGWGSWGGHNLKPVSRRKRKKFVIKFPRVIPRRDTNRGNVIINEDADKPIKEHQVSEVPFPFTSVQEYEASVRAPLGSTWVPQTAHQKLTLPAVVTKMGTVISPMDEDQLVKINKSKTLPKRSIKGQNLKT